MTLIQAQTQIWEGADLTTMARLVGVNGVTIVLADVSGAGGSEVTLKLFHIGSRRPEQALVTTLLNKTAVIFNTLQTDAYWSEDDLGYNFRHTLDGDGIPHAGHFRAQYTFQADGQVPAFGLIAVVTEFHAEAVL